MSHDTNENKKPNKCVDCIIYAPDYICNSPFCPNIQNRNNNLEDNVLVAPSEVSSELEDRFEEIIKEYIRAVRKQAKKEVVEGVTKWADENMADGDWTYEHLLIFLSKQ